MLFICWDQISFNFLGHSKVIVACHVENICAQGHLKSLVLSQWDVQLVLSVLHRNKRNKFVLLEHYIAKSHFGGLLMLKTVMCLSSDQTILLLMYTSCACTWLPYNRIAKLHQAENSAPSWSMQRSLRSFKCGSIISVLSTCVHETCKRREITSLHAACAKSTK